MSITVGRGAVAPLGVTETKSRPFSPPPSAATQASTRSPAGVTRNIGVAPLAVSCDTTEVGENVTMYQGVTLGGTGFATGKRHPTVQDNVTIGSGAKLLGPITIGHGAKIGANAVVIHDVPPNSTVVGNPGHTVRVEGRKPEGPDADWVHLPDPIADALKQLSRRIAELERELAALKGAEGGDDADVVPLRPVHGPNPAGG